MYLTYMVGIILTRIEVEKNLKKISNIYLGTFHNNALYVKYVLFCVGDS